MSFFRSVSHLVYRSLKYSFFPSLSTYPPTHLLDEYQNKMTGFTTTTTLFSLLLLACGTAHAHIGAWHSARFVAIALCLNRLTSPQHPQNKLVFTASPDAQFESFNLDDMQYNDAKLSIYFETQEIMEESLILLRFNCPDSDCVFIAKGWDDLKTHARTVHG